MLGRRIGDDTIRVVLCDDHEMFLEGLEAILRGAADIEVVGVARDGESALGLERELEPDVLVLDLHLGGGMSGWDVLERRKRRGGGPGRVLIASGLAADSDVQGAVDDGASGYVLKAANSKELVLAIRRLAGGEVYFSPDVQRALLPGLSNRSGGKPTQREARVLRMIGSGATDEQIAERLNISRTTVRRALDGLYEKLGTDEGRRKREALVLKAIERGWL